MGLLVRKRLLLPLLSGVVAWTGAGSALAYPIDGSPASEREQILVRYAESPSGACLSVLEPALGLRLSHEIGPLGVRVLDGPPELVGPALQQLQAMPGVDFAERDGPLVAAEQTPNDPFWSLQWAGPKINAPRAWDVTTGTPKVVVAVLDSGVDGNHPELRGKLVAGYDEVNGDTDAADDNGHGTAVAGVVAANTNNSGGIAAVCWGCSIMPVKVLSTDGSGSDSQVAAGMVWAVDHGARVLNLSLGGPTASRTMELAVRYARERGAVVVAAAGNGASTTPTYPAAFPGVLGVAASDENDRLYPFSNSGPWVPLAAPGMNVAPGLLNTYLSFVGTSAASPVVAGVAGLAQSLGAQAAQIEQALKETAVPIAGVTAGRVDAFAAVSRFAPPPTGSSPGGTTQPGQPSGASPAPPGTVSPSTLAPSTRLRRVYRGHLARRLRSRRYVVATGTGRLITTLTVKGAARLQLKIASPSGKILARGRVRRRGTLRIVVPAGRYRLVVSGLPRRRTAFTLLASYPRPD